jgi:hypothetical protein
VREAFTIRGNKDKKRYYIYRKQFYIKNDGVIRAKLLNFIFWYYDYVKYFNKDIKELANIENSIKAISEKNIYDI